MAITDAPGGDDERVLLDSKITSEQTVVADLEEGDTVLFEYDFEVNILPGGLYRFTGEDPGPEDPGTTPEFAHEKVAPTTQICPVILEFEVNTTDEYILYVAGERDCPGDGGHVTVTVLS